MRLVPWWTYFSSGCAPLLLVGGWTGAAALQGPGYDPVRQTISVLAAYGAAGYWVMTATMIALGACHVITACGLRVASLTGRLALGGGGISAMTLAVFPAPDSGGSLPHGSVVAVGFALLAVWPVLAVERGRDEPWGLRLAPSIVASAVMWAGGVWFLLELQVFHAAGIAERALTLAQSLWPFVVVASCLHVHSQEPHRT